MDLAICEPQIYTRNAAPAAMLTRAAAFEPSTWNADKGTIELIFSTGADVARCWLT